MTELPVTLSLPLFAKVEFLPSTAATATQRRHGIELQSMIIDAESEFLTPLYI